MAGTRTLRNVFTVGALTSLSRVLGLAREMLQSRFIGAGVEQSAFTLAFAIPNMARKLFGEGALTAAFVPVFKGEVEREGVEKAAKLARAVITMMMLMVGAIVVLALTGVLVAGSVTVLPEKAYRYGITLELVAILLPYMLAICGAAFGMGVLNALGKFKASSFMPALLNVVWIAALGTVSFFPGLSVHHRIVIIASAILAGGFAQMAFMFRCMAKVGVSPWPLFAGWKNENVRLVWRNTGIAAVGAGAVQINYLLDQVLGQLAAPWAAGVIGYAERLMDLPLGVIGVAFGTVLLPTFSGLFAKSDMEGARAALSSSVCNLMFVMVPSAVGLFVLAPEVTSVIYEGNAFDAQATVRVSRALAVYALGLGFFGYQKSIIPWFQAQHDMKTPLRVSVQMVVLNAVLNIAAVFGLPVEWRHVGLAASTVLCAGVGAVVLTVHARRKNGTLGLWMIAGTLAKIAAAAALMGMAVWAAKIGLAGMNKVVALGIEIIVGMVCYAALALCFRLQFRRKL